MLAVLVCMSSMALAEGFLIDGATWTTTSGYPWTSDDTNYKYTLGLNDTFIHYNQPNSGPSALGATEADWKTPGVVTLSGSVTQLPTSVSSYLQIGIINRGQVERAYNGFKSYMFNNAAFLTFTSSNVAVGEAYNSHTNIATGLTANDILDYEVQFDIANQIVSGRVNVNDGGWTGWTSQSFGTDNWYLYGYNEYADFENVASFENAAVLVNFYNEAGEAQTPSTTTFGDVKVHNAPPVPEASSVALACTAIVPLVGLKLRKRQ